MNRRTFLTLTGLTVIGVPSLSLSKRKPQWIRMLEQPPKVGQKIIMISHYGYYYDITGGMVKELDLGLSHKHHTSLIHIGVDFMKHSQNPSIYGIGSAEGEKVIMSTSKKWFCLEEDSKFETYRESNNLKIHIRSYYLTNYYWLPVDGEYPETLPPFPKYIASWMLFTQITPGQDNLIEVKNEAGEIKKGRFVETIDYKTNEKSRNLVLDPTPFYMEIKNSWYWRHVS